MMFAMFSCNSSKELTSVFSLNGDWNIIEINGTAVNTVKGQGEPYITFEAATGKLSGNSGCNRMMGSFDVNARPGVLDMSSIGSTRMMCDDMTTETNVLNALKNVTGFRKADNDRMALTNSSDRPVIILEPRKSPDPLSLLEGEWKITEVYGSAVPEDIEKKPFLNFNTTQKSIHGNAGCNIMNGRITTDDRNISAISFPTLATTMMACPDMETERNVLNALNSVKSYRILSSDSAGLYDGTGGMVILLSR